MTAAKKAALKQYTLGGLLDENYPEREKLLGDWLKDRHLSMIYAPTGVGKSWFTLSIALAIAGGGEFLEWKAPRTTRVLIIDGEMDMQDLQERARLILPTLNVDVATARDNLLIVARLAQGPEIEFPDISTPEGRQVIFNIAREHNAALVILDNFSTLCAIEDENAAHSFDPVLTMLQQLKLDGRAGILVHHAKKGDKNKGSYRGTSKMAVVFDSIISLYPPNNEHEDGKTEFVIDFEKFRAERDETTRTRIATLSKDGEGQTRWSVRPEFDPALVEIVEAIRSLKFVTQTELVEHLGVSKGEISKRKREAIRQGVLGMTAREWGECLSEAKEIRWSDSEMDTDF